MDSTLIRRLLRTESRVCKHRLHTKFRLSNNTQFLSMLQVQNCCIESDGILHEVVPLSELEPIRFQKKSSPRRSKSIICLIYTIIKSSNLMQRIRWTFTFRILVIGTSCHSILLGCGHPRGGAQSGRIYLEER